MSAFTRESTVRLSSGWLFSIDPDNVGVDEGWYDPDIELPDAHNVEVPHAWQEHDELREYTGTAWYRQSFSLNRDVEGRMLLRFGAVDYEATVWVNGIAIGSNRGGYLPFVFDVTDALCTDENVVAVRVHDPEDVTEIPHGKQGDPWYTRVSGIWQNVSLVEVPETYVTSAQATPDLDADTVNIAITVASETEDNLRVRVSVTQEGQTLGSAGGRLTDDEGEITVDLDDPTYWTPAMPALCEFEVELRTGDGAIDTYSDYFGMRTVSVKDGEWYLNGEPLCVRGALDQAYYPDTLYRPDGSISYRQEVEMAKELGFNLLRKHIKPAHPEFIELADRHGLLVWEEPANPDVFTERSKREVREQFEGMVERDYNRPSVIVWSLYNEEWGIGNDQTTSTPDEAARLWNDEDKQEYLSTFYTEARELDPTRLICDNSGWAHVNTDINDYHEYFVVPDRADAWRERLEAIGATPKANYATTKYDDPETAPIVISEFGTWGLPDVERLRGSSGGDPPWFTHGFLDGLKRPEGIDDRFAESALSDAFDDLSSLATAWQHRELTSIEGIIRDMRNTAEVSGYVLTEFTDIEWEFNGVLDYRREPKRGLERFAAVNAPVTAWAVPRKRVHWDDDSLVADIVVVNDTPDTTPVTMEWEAFDHSETLDIEIAGNDIERIPRAIDVPIQPVDTPQMESVTVRLLEQDLTATSDVVVAPAGTAVPDVTVAPDDEGLADALTRRGYELATPDTADVTIRTGETGTEDGDDTLVLPDSGGDFGDVDDVAFATLPERESWNLCACFVAQTLFDGVDVVPGWAFEDLYPYAYVENVKADDTIRVAYTEGWLANSGAISLTRRTADGTLGICSLRLVDGYGEHPMATAVLDRLLEQFA